MASDRVYIITGAGRGIGLACAQRLIEDGHNLVLADKNPIENSQNLQDLVNDNKHAIFIECDISEPLEVHNLIAEALSHFNHIDGLINNAAIIQKGGILDIKLEDFDRIMAINLRGAFLTARAVARYMVEEIDNREDRSRLTQRPYAIVNMSSINDRLAMAEYFAYCVSKGGLKQMTKALALELAPYGIRVNGIGPGSIKTDMLSQNVIGDKSLEDIKARTPLGRLGQASEIANIAAFLLSDDASYITGQHIYADGGRLALNHIIPSATVAP